MDFSGGQAMNGYRWFQYVNSIIFNLNTSVELVVYFTITWVLSLLIGLQVMASLPKHSEPYKYLLVFAIPVVLNSLVGSGSRGMELGTYGGLLIMIGIFKSISSGLRSKYFLVIVVTGPPVLFLVFMGGYTNGFTGALLIVYLADRIRPKLESLVMTRVKMLLVSSVTSMLIFSWLVAQSDSNGTQFTHELFTQVRRNVLFPLGYVFAGQAGGLISIQTLEKMSTPASILTTFAIAAVVTTLLVSAIILAYRWEWCRSISLTLTSIYGITAAVSLLPFRAFNVQTLISTWYVLHFKIALAGTIGLFIVAISKRKLKMKSWPTVFALLIPMFVLISVMANIRQWQREPFERKYMTAIVQDSLFTSGLKENASGLTSLQISLAASLQAIEIQREHQLGVFRDIDKSLKLVGAYGKPFFLTGDVYGDGWVGEKFSVYVLDSKCKSLTVQLVTDVMLKTTRASISSNFGESKTVEVGTEQRSLQFPISGTLPELNFEFSKTFVPSKMSESQDGRTLASVVSVSCSS